MSNIQSFAVILTVSALAGCASNGAVAPLSNEAAMSKTGAPARSIVPQTYAKIEAVFQLPNLAGDPFDYEKNDVKVEFRRAGGGSVVVPAFFDGGTTWRARHTPMAPGSYSVFAITLNGKALKVVAAPKSWKVGGQGQPGFVRIDPHNSQRFVRTDGTPYFPLGHDQAWHSTGLPEIPVMFDKMKAAGENWSRVWMNHWDGKNLDWPKPGPFGTLDLKVAKTWDGIVEAAERDGIEFQMTLQHHGQYSSQVNPNWDDNPYNVKNGGFLQKPEDFFTDAQAKALTKRKLRYIVARWGYSPSNHGVGAVQRSSVHRCGA